MTPVQHRFVLSPFREEFPFPALLLNYPTQTVESFKAIVWGWLLLSASGIDSVWFTAPDVRQLLLPLDAWVLTAGCSEVDERATLTSGECQPEQSSSWSAAGEDGLLSFRLTDHTPASDRRRGGPPRRNSSTEDAAYNRRHFHCYPPWRASCRSLVPFCILPCWLWKLLSIWRKSV